MILLGPLYHMVDMLFSTSTIIKPGWYMSMAGVWLQVKPWLVVCFTPITIRYDPCLTQHSWKSGIVYPDLHDQLWLTVSPRECVVLNIHEKKQDNTSWACLGFGLRWSCGSWLVTQLLDMVHIPYNTPATVIYHLQTCMEIIGPLLHLVEMSRSIRKPGW